MLSDARSTRRTRVAFALLALLALAGCDNGSETEGINELKANAARQQQQIDRLERAVDKLESQPAIRQQPTPAETARFILREGSRDVPYASRERCEEAKAAIIESRRERDERQITIWPLVTCIPA